MRNRSVTYSTEAAFHALADPTRRSLLDLALFVSAILSVEGGDIIEVVVQLSERGIKVGLLDSGRGRVVWSAAKEEGVEPAVGLPHLLCSALAMSAGSKTNWPMRALSTRSRYRSGTKREMLTGRRTAILRSPGSHSTRVTPKMLTTRRA